MPLLCIANNYTIGKTPECLLQLSPVELAMITPVQTFGYCFSYTGGLQKQLKGSLSYYKISPETIVRTGARFDGIRLNNHVVVLIYGCMTAQQIEVTRKKYKVNTGKIIEALCVHNWSNVTNWNYVMLS
jgi:hypothetical protein